MRTRVLRLMLAAVHRAPRWAPRIFGALAVVVIVVGVVAFQREGRAVGQPATWHEALYYTLGLFTFAGNRFGYPRTALLQVVYLAAPLIAGTAVLGAFVQLLAERAPLMVLRLRGHVVIGGLGHLGASIVRDLRTKGQPFVAIERHEGAPEAANVRASGDGVVLIGDFTSAEVLRRARCHHATRVFFTSPDDVANLDAAFHIRRLARHALVRHPPTVFAHVYDVALSEALRHQLRAADPHEAAIVPFNSYRFAAKALVAGLLRDGLVTSLRVAPGVALTRTRWPVDDPDAREVPASGALDEDRRRLLRAFRVEADDVATELPARYAVVGLGRFGRAVLRELLDTVPLACTYLLVDRSVETLRQSAEVFAPSEHARTEVVQGDATSAAVLTRLAAWRPTAVLVCTDNDISNLRLALDLHVREVKTVTRMFDLEANSELGRGLAERGIRSVGLAQLFRAAIPILLRERQLRACLNLDVTGTAQLDHLFYLAHVSPQDRQRLGRACVELAELATGPEAPAVPSGLGLVWHAQVHLLAASGADYDEPARDPRS